MRCPPLATSPNWAPASAGVGCVGKGDAQLTCLTITASDVSPSPIVRGKGPVAYSPGEG
jgi:hypothetical protein